MNAPWFSPFFIVMGIFYFLQPANTVVGWRKREKMATIHTSSPKKQRTCASASGLPAEALA
ncbi:MAG: hypothetical protein A3H70_05025 [Candidatus Komeilibacteria bacterium RIFCSPLOWO2_02_FULL_48_11]|uniref:Uncharacterized protein n=1 Tax=Candidatus Komeilibacteria bacterium RIFCSPLOWO2_02_FULL_48_11 TaxID=1798553 RepID=A0A1G2BUC1_9BACT|nr:MAG: hypothetical protein A3H70_05025 [Candidatus Komeilibacteria bacterium RIFCSPLOWO2_02_FULL_48_11]